MYNMTKFKTKYIVKNIHNAHIKIVINLKMWSNYKNCLKNVQILISVHDLVEGGISVIYS